MNLRNPPERVVIGTIIVAAIVALVALGDLDAQTAFGGVMIVAAGLGLTEANVKREPPNRERRR